MIRFNTWEITRFNRSTTYMFLTPDLIQQGQYQVSGNRYFFRAVMASELEVADKNRLVGEIDPDAARGFEESYAKSMSNFEGRFDRTSKALYISYMVKGRMQIFELHAINEGDDRLSSTVSESERGLVGVWHAPEPFPDKLDARTRAKVDEFGLRLFIKEAMASDAAQFDVIDLRSDKTFRKHSTVGTWSRNGSTLTLMVGSKRTDMSIANDGKLYYNGKVAYVR